MVSRSRRSATDSVIELLSSSQSPESSDNEKEPQNNYKYISRKTQQTQAQGKQGKKIPSSSDDDDDDDENVKNNDMDSDDEKADEIVQDKRGTRATSTYSGRAQRRFRSGKSAFTVESDPDSDIAIANESSLIQLDDGDESQSAGSDNEHYNDSDDDDDDDDDYNVQVPDSSPLKKPKKPLMRPSAALIGSKSKLPSLRSFEYNPKKERTAVRLTSPSISTTGSTSSDYIEMKKAFPDLPSGTIISALKKYKTIAKTYIHLKSISKSMPKKNLSISRQNGRLDSLSRRQASLGLSSSPLRSPTSSTSDPFSSLSTKSRSDRKLQEKYIPDEDRKRAARERERESARRKAEKESIVSSRVQISAKDRGLKDRYLSSRLNSRKKFDNEEDEEEEEADDDDDDENDESDGIEIIESDDSLEEITAPPKRSKRGKRYESDDNDYNPNGKSKKHKTGNRADRAERRAVVAEDDDFMLPGFEADEDAGLNITEKIVKLFNNADIRDIIDLTNMKLEEATIMVESRPYRNLSEIQKVDVQPGRVIKAKSFRNPMEKYLETATQKLSAYSAIDTLLKQCFEYSKSITRDIRKWGVNLKGKNLDGEIAITSVNVSSEEESDSEDSDDEAFVSKPQEKRTYNKKKFRLDGSEFDDDFSSSSIKKVYKSALDNSKVKDKDVYFKKKPALMPDDIILKDYQQVGINWIHLLFKKQLSCILADEMGLGKTAQVIAFLSHLKKKRYPGPHLIVVPSSTLENWLREFEKFSPTLKVVPYYGSMDEREELKSVLYEDDYDVVVTTYNLTTGKNDAVFLQSLNFNVIVYDEGHMLKNATSDRYKKLNRLKANFRLLLTGTPLQNNLKELISLLDFILPEVFSPKMSKLEFLFDQRATTKPNDTKIEGKNFNPLMSEQAISKAKVMMSPFVLRRTKAQVMKDLPQKHTSIEYCSLVPSQSRIYEEELKGIQELRAEKAKRKLMSEIEVRKLPPLTKRSTNILMTLRKACMHPLLFRRLYTDQMLKVMSRAIVKNPAFMNANEHYVFEDFQVMSDFEITQFCHTYPNELGKFVLRQSIYEDSGKVRALVDMLKKIVEKGEKVLIFSMFTQMLDVLEKVLSLHGWKFLRLDGSTTVDTRQTMIDKFYEDKTIPIFLLSTKAGGFGINLICANNVILYDQSLNPHDDKQAEDRAHRVGQTKEVNVVRLITKNSIEENILQMAFNKLQLDNSMMAQNVEDVLLKTVEDILESKEEAAAQGKKDEENNNDEKKEETPMDAFEAFEAPIALEIAASESSVEPVEVIEDPIGSGANGSEDSTKKRTRRKRQQVNYSERGIVQLTDDLLMEADDDDDINDKKKKKDKNFEPGEKPVRKYRKRSPKTGAATTTATTTTTATAGTAALDEGLVPLAPKPPSPSSGDMNVPQNTGMEIHPKLDISSNDLVTESIAPGNVVVTSTVPQSPPRVNGISLGAPGLTSTVPMAEDNSVVKKENVVKEENSFSKPIPIVINGLNLLMKQMSQSEKKVSVVTPVTDEKSLAPPNTSRCDPLEVAPGIEQVRIAPLVNGELKKPEIQLELKADSAIAVDVTSEQKDNPPLDKSTEADTPSKGINTLTDIINASQEMKNA
jgi:SWI/SNF-related matrix-associated actin-dependent regulator of chromatin subfamily A containing DEAD/H box 1